MSVESGAIMPIRIVRAARTRRCPNWQAAGSSTQLACSSSRIIRSAEMMIDVPFARDWAVLRLAV